MIYSNITDNSRTHFIIISSNYDSSSSSFIGSKINIKTDPILFNLIKRLLLAVGIY